MELKIIKILKEKLTQDEFFDFLDNLENNRDFCYFNLLSDARFAAKEMNAVRYYERKITV